MLVAKAARDANNTQSSICIGPLAGFGKLRASHGQNAYGNMDPSEIAALIEAGLPGADVTVRSPDNTHFEAIVVSSAFHGKRRLQRHQLIYKCLGNLMGNEIHAMSIRAHTPGEWREQESAGQA